VLWLLPSKLCFQIAPHTFWVRTSAGIVHILTLFLAIFDDSDIRVNALTGLCSNVQIGMLFAKTTSDTFAAEFRDFFHKDSAFAELANRWPHRTQSRVEARPIAAKRPLIMLTHRQVQLFTKLPRSTGNTVRVVPPTQVLMSTTQMTPITWRYVAGSV